MGQQQLLLIVVGTIIVVIAIYLGITLFRSNAVDIKRDNLINESVHLVSLAQKYYHTRIFLGYSTRSFIGWQIPHDFQTTGNGRYEAQVYDDSVVITGIGNEVILGTSDSVKISMTAYPSTYQVTIIN